MQSFAPPSGPAWCAYTRQEAALILRVPVCQIDAAIRRGDLEVSRIGKHVRISDSELRKFAKQAPAEVAA